MDKCLKVIIYFTFLFTSSLWASDRTIPQKYEKNWSEKSVFFGVNQAWDYKPQQKTIMTFYSREKYRPFDFNQFPTEKYKDYLTELRNSGLKFIGISNWKISHFQFENIGKDKILIKVKGTYQKESGIVHFNEWQVFDGYLYSQINLIEEETSDFKNVSSNEVDEIFKGVLHL